MPITDIDKKMDWLTDCDHKTYLVHGGKHLPIPEHEHLDELYWDVYDYAYNEYFYVGQPWSEFISDLEKKYGPISEELRAYLDACPRQAGFRAGLLKDDPNHYD